jgi:hypothetical protein
MADGKSYSTQNFYKAPGINGKDASQAIQNYVNSPGYGTTSLGPEEPYINGGIEALGGPRFNAEYNLAPGLHQEDVAIAAMSDLGKSFMGIFMNGGPVAQASRTIEQDQMSKQSLAALQTTGGSAIAKQAAINAQEGQMSSSEGLGLQNSVAGMRLQQAVQAARARHVDTAKNLAITGVQQSILNARTDTSYQLQAAAENAQASVSDTALGAALGQFQNNVSYVNAGLGAAASTAAAASSSMTNNKTPGNNGGGSTSAPDTSGTALAGSGSAPAPAPDAAQSNFN